MKPITQAMFAAALIGFLVQLIASAELDGVRIAAPEFDKKLKIDTSKAGAAARDSVSYADVVQGVLPSVVSISRYSSNPDRGLNWEVVPDDFEHLPPSLRDFFGDWLGRREPSDPGERRRSVPKKPVQTGLGSGVIITADGFILTNSHVVDESEELKVVLSGRSKSFKAKVIGSDPQTDVALIKIEEQGLIPATIGDSSQLRVGDVVLAVGSPMGLEQSVTQGIVSGLGRSGMGIIGDAESGQPGYENFVQTDAAINPGNSGGPLLDAQGRVVGLNTAIETRSGMFAGIGLAIPINMAIAVARDLLDDGVIQRGFLGVEIGPVEPSLAEYLELSEGEGAVVSLVMDNSPAKKAGFQEGDVIVSIDGQKISGPAQLRLLVSGYAPGSSVVFGVVRHDPKSKHPAHLELKAKLNPLPEKRRSSGAEKSSGAERSDAEVELVKGVWIEDLAEESRARYRIGDEVEGAVIARVEEGADSADVVEEGDVVVAVDGEPVTSAAEAIEKRGKGGHPIQLKVVRNGRVAFVVVRD
jgi:serine protease Do